MAITNLPTKLTSAGNQGDAGDYSTAASTVFQIDYSGLDYTPKTTDDYKNDFEEELQVFINGTRIYRLSTDTGIDDAGGLNTAQKSRLTNLNSSFGNEPWDIVTGTKKVQINQLHTAFGDSDGNSPGYPALNTWNIIKVIRIKPDKSTLATDFQSASVLTEAELDNAFSETFHMAQESVDTATDALSLDTDNVWNANSTRIKNLGQPTANNDAVRKVDVDSGIGADITAVANIQADVTTLAHLQDGTTLTNGLTNLHGKTAEMTLLGTSAVVEDMQLLGTQDVVDDLALLAHQSVKDDMALLADSGVITDMDILGTNDNVSNMDTCADNISNVNAVALSIAGSQTYTVTVTNPGSGNVFVLDGTNNPAITLTKGFTYTFDQSDSSNSGHTLKIRDDDDNEYTNGVTLTGTPGSAGAKTVFVVPANAPTTGLRYHCVAHLESMGNTITTANNDLGEVASIGASNLNTVATNAESNAIVMGIALG